MFSYPEKDGLHGLEVLENEGLINRWSEDWLHCIVARIVAKLAILLKGGCSYWQFDCDSDNNLLEFLNLQSEL